MVLAFAGFAFANSITPGPNNVMLLASGVNFGFWRTVPHILGVSLGCVVMLVVVGLGLERLFAAMPFLYRILRVGSVAYLLWLAWRIASAGPARSGSVSGGPLRFWQAAAFQWINPKAWIMVVGAASTYAPRDHFLRNILLIALLLGLVNLPSVSLWAGCGTHLRRLLSHPRRLRLFNLTMAGLLVLSLVPILSEQ
jgi:threonine/homoserine/homoserine lactone efflux protein